MNKNFEQMNKQELLEFALSHAHIVDAIEAKDAELIKKEERIKSLERALTELNAELKTTKKTVENQSHLADAIEAKDKEVNELTNKLEHKTREFKEANFKYENVNSELNLTKEDLQKISEDLQKKNKVLAAYIGAYRSFMKNIQGGLENSIELEALIFDTLK